MLPSDTLGRILAQVDYLCSSEFYRASLPVYEKEAEKQEQAETERNDHWLRLASESAVAEFLPAYDFGTQRKDAEQRSTENPFVVVSLTWARSSKEAAYHREGWSLEPNFFKF
jgi:hypothetical protein